MVSNFKEKYVQGFKPSNIWLEPMWSRPTVVILEEHKCVCAISPPVYHFQIPCSVAGLGSGGFVEGVVPRHMARNCRPSFEVSGLRGPHDS